MPSTHPAPSSPSYHGDEVIVYHQRGRGREGRPIRLLLLPLSLYIALQSLPPASKSIYHYYKRTSPQLVLFGLEQGGKSIEINPTQPLASCSHASFSSGLVYLYMMREGEAPEARSAYAHVHILSSSSSLPIHPTCITHRFHSTHLLRYLRWRKRDIAQIHLNILASSSSLLVYLPMCYAIIHCLSPRMYGSCSCCI